MRLPQTSGRRSKKPDNRSRPGPPADGQKGNLGQQPGKRNASSPDHPIAGDGEGVPAAARLNLARRVGGATESDQQLSGLMMNQKACGFVSLPERTLVSRHLKSWVVKPSRK